MIFIAIAILKISHISKKITLALYTFEYVSIY